MSARLNWQVKTTLGREKKNNAYTVRNKILKRNAGWRLWGEEERAKKYFHLRLLCSAQKVFPFAKCVCGTENKVFCWGTKMHHSAPPRRGSKQQNNFEGWKRKIRRWSRNSRSWSTGKLFCKGDGGVEIYFAMVMEEWEVILQRWWRSGKLYCKCDGGVGSYIAKVMEEWEVICKGERKVGNFL